MVGTLKQTKGFTIIELLIVIVVIGILAAITVVAFNGVQGRALNTIRVNEAKQWQQLFMAYSVQNGKYPVVNNANQRACLGNGYPDNNSDGIGNCWDVHTAGHTSVDTVLNAELATMGTLPQATRVPLKGIGAASRLGPAVEIVTSSYSTYRIIYWQTGQATCPIGIANWTDGSTSVSCRIELPVI